MKDNTINISEDGSGLLLMPPLRPGPSLIVEADHLPHFVGRVDWAPVTPLPSAMTQSLAQWLARWKLTELRVSRDFGPPESLVVDICFSSGLRVGYADPPQALFDPKKIAKYDVVFAADNAAHATVRRNGERNGALTLSIGARDTNLSRDRFVGFPKPTELSKQVADAWEARWGTRPQPSKIENIGGRW